MSVCERMARRRVPIADIASWGVTGWFARRPAESRNDHGNRICSQAGVADLQDKAKVLKYARAGKKGAKFPPVFLLTYESALVIEDGWHRVCAAAYSGRKAIDAVVFDAKSAEERDAVGEIISALECFRVPACAGLGRLTSRKRRGNARVQLNSPAPASNPPGAARSISEQVEYDVERDAAMLHGAEVLHVTMPDYDKHGRSWFVVSTTVNGKSKAVTYLVPPLPHLGADAAPAYRALVVMALKSRGFSITSAPNVVLAGEVL